MKAFVTSMIGAAAVCVAWMMPSDTAWAQAHDAHAHHHPGGAAVQRADKLVRSTSEYRIPQLQLTRADGKAVSLPDEIGDGRAVVLNFIFTTCTEICPVSSQIFRGLQDKVVPSDKVHLMSISIDPMHDTPAVLREYEKKFGAGKGWNFYTGTPEASVATQKAFDVYRGDKMNHIPVTFVRPAYAKSWVRLDGFASADDVLRELRQNVAQK